MTCTTNKNRLRLFRVFSVFIILILISKTECKGGGRSGGHSSGGHSSGGHSSSGHSYGGSHSSSHSTSYGSGHSSYGGSYHSTSHGSSNPSYGGGSHSYGSESSGHSYSGSGGISHPGAYTPIGFDHVNQQAHHSVNGAAGRPGIGFDHVNSQATGHATYNQFHSYKPLTVPHYGSGYVHYQPPTQLQYTPPSTVQHSTGVHYVPVYQPTVIHTQSSSTDNNVGSFLGGYLVGRITSGHSHSSSSTHHVTNNYYNTDTSDDRPSNSYYTVHHYHQNRENVPSSFSVPGEEITQCDSSVTDTLCVPNTNAFCLKNGTIMCTTPTVLTSPCEQNSTTKCVYSRIPCNPNLACNATANQTYVDFYLPCIASATYVNNRVLDINYITAGSYELCVTAIAHPRKLESPFGAVANFITELGKWHLEQLIDIHNLTTPTNHTIV